MERRNNTNLGVSTKRKYSTFVHDVILRLVKLLDLFALVVPFVYIWFKYYADELFAIYYSGNWIIIFFYLIILSFYGRTYDAFQINFNRISDVIYSQGLAALFTNFIFYFLIILLTRRLITVLPLILCLGLQIGIAAIWATVAHKWYYHTFPKSKTIVIYNRIGGKENLINEYGYDKKFEIIGMYQVKDIIEKNKSDREMLNEPTDSNLDLLKDADSVFIVDLHSHDRNIILKYCVEHEIIAFVQPRIGDLLMQGAQEKHMFHLPMLRVDRYKPSPEYLLIKRLFDIVSASLVFLLISPIFVATAIAIHAYDQGPVFYKQVRLTKNGKEFKVLKFRSMRVDAEKDGVARLSTGEADPRITPVGRFIRKVRLDELPQLINIIKGDMSVVGPRPERPEIARQYETVLPEFSLRLQAKAGLTGYAQVYGKYNTEPYDKLGMDLMYISNPSIVQDIRIIFATIKILFMPESTEGVAAGQTTAMDYENAADSIENDAETVAK